MRFNTGMCTVCGRSFRTSRVIGLLSLVAMVTASALALVAQESERPAGADWPTYNRDLAGTRFSPLDQINTRNVRSLREALVVSIPSRGGLRRGAESVGAVSAGHAHCG